MIYTRFGTPVKIIKSRKSEGQHMRPYVTVQREDGSMFDTCVAELKADSGSLEIYQAIDAL